MSTIGFNGGFSAGFSPAGGVPEPTAPPVITLQPLNVMVDEGLPWEITSAATGAASSEWFKDAVSTGNFTNSISGIGLPSESGLYYNRYTNIIGDTDTDTSDVDVVADVVAGTLLFGVTTYIGDGTASRDIFTDVDGTGDVVLMIRRRDVRSAWSWMDTVTGVGTYRNITAGGITVDTNRVLGITANGLTVGSAMNALNAVYAVWTWKANTLEGGIVDIMQYQGNGANNRFIAQPSTYTKNFLLVKGDAGGSWIVGGNYATHFGGTDKYLRLENTGAAVSDSTMWNNTVQSSTGFTVGSGAANTNGLAYTAYTFKSATGAGKAGQYIGDGAGRSPRISTVNRQEMAIFKAVTASSDWIILDATRKWETNQNDARLRLNRSSAEDDVGRVGNRDSNSISGYFSAESQTNNSGVMYAAFSWFQDGS